MRLHPSDLADCLPALTLTLTLRSELFDAVVLSPVAVIGFFAQQHVIADHEQPTQIHLRCLSQPFHCSHPVHLLCYFYPITM